MYRGAATDLTGNSGILYDRDGKPYNMKNGQRYYLPSRPGQVVDPRTGDIIGEAKGPSGTSLYDPGSEERFHVMYDPDKPKTEFPPSFAAFFKVAFVAWFFYAVAYAMDSQIEMGDFLLLWGIMSVGIVVYYLLPGMNSRVKSVYLWN